MTTTLKLILACATLVSVCVCLAEAGPTRTCDIDEYYQTVLEQCEPCKKICDPLNRMDCVKSCSDYILSLTCAGDQFWDSILQTCMPCQSICDPLNRTVCQQKCLGFIESMQIVTLDPEMPTDAPIPQANAEIPQANAEIPEAHSSFDYTILIIVSLVMAITLTAVIITLVVRFRQKIRYYCRQICGYEPKTKPIQATGGETTVSLLDITVGGNTQPSSLESN